jgi:type II secretory pathway pseudopilin PulG
VIRPPTITRSVKGQSRGAGAFTFVELVVVIVIVSIVAGLVIPRITSWKSRQGELSVYAIADLLSAAAKRDVYSTQPAALEFDSKTASLRLMALQVTNAASFDPGAETWVQDPLTPVATLVGVHLLAGAAGPQDLDPRRFRVEFPGAGGAQGRVGVALLFGDDEGQRWLVKLPPSGTRADVVPNAANKGLPTNDADTIDLDATGMRDEAW